MYSLGCFSQLCGCFFKTFLSYNLVNIQMFGVGEIFFLFERNNTYIQQGHIKLSDSKDFYYVAKDLHFK